jgi:uncharacterized metal-binding protein
MAGGVLIAVPARTTLGFERFRLRTHKLGRAGIVVAVGLALIVVSNLVRDVVPSAVEVQRWPQVVQAAA